MSGGSSVPEGSSVPDKPADTEKPTETPSEIAAETVSLSQTSLTLKEGEEATFKVTVK